MTASASTRHVLRNIVSNWGSAACTLAVSFFLSPFVVHQIGDTSYGIWALVGSLTSYMGLLDLGVRSAVTRYVARFHVQARNDSSCRIASSALAIFAFGGLIAIAVATVLAFTATSRFQIPAEYRDTARAVLILAGANVAVSLVSGVFGGVVTALQRLDILYGAEILITCLRAVSIVVALRAGLGLLSLAVIQLLFTVARGMFNALISFRLYPGLRVGLAWVDRSHLRTIFAFSTYAFLIRVAVDLIYYSDTIVIAAYLPVRMITFFTIGSTLVEYTRVLITGISEPLSPFASALEARNDTRGVQSALLNGSRVASMITLPILATFMLRGQTYIGLWMGSEYAATSGRVLWILSLMMLFSAAINPVGGILLGIGKHKPLVPVRLAEGLLNLAFSLWWVRTAGVVGVAWGTALPGIAFNIVFWPWYVRLVLGIPLTDFVLSSWVRPGLSILPFVVATYAVERLWPPTSLWAFFGQTLAVLPLAPIGYWAGCFDPAQRRRCWHRVSRTVNSRAGKLGWGLPAK